MRTWRRAAWWGVATVLCLGRLGGAPAAAPPPTALHVIVTGLTLDYLEPCGCGGQNAGGLARRAAMVAELRRQWPDVVLIDSGQWGVIEARRPIIARALAAMGTDAVALSGDELANWDQIGPLLAGHGLVGTAVQSAGKAPPWLVVGPPDGPRLAVVSVSWGESTRAQMAAAVQSALQDIAAAHVDHVALVAHLPRADAEALLAMLPDRLQPELLLLATDDNLPAPAETRGGVTWVPMAHNGRSLSAITLEPGRPPRVEQRLVADGPRDAAVQAWIDAYFAQMQAGEAQPATDKPASFPRVAACRPCHGAVVEAWRGHPHARAVETLIAKQRDVAACLRCHDERLRRDGVRSGPGDRGVECASCHDGLPAHLAQPTSKATSPSVGLCRHCHDDEHSPHWSADTYLASVRAVCEAR